MVIIVSGAKEENIIDDAKIKARVDYFVSLGLSVKDAINVVSEEYSLNKNYIKQLVF